MNEINSKNGFIFLLFISLILVGFSDDGKKAGRLQSTATTAYLFQVNEFKLPLNNSGVLADVAAPGFSAGGKFNNKGVLYSGGFFIGGYSNDFLFVNAVATASRIQDYQPGKVGTDSKDSKFKLYILKSSDSPFGESWQEWKTAVELGADFYDGDNDRVYNPVDKNANGIWDKNEDRPGLIGDETVYCVYNDGVPKSMRRYTDVDPQGIEVHQTVFGFNEISPLSNTFFVKYKLINRGTVAEKLDSVIFSLWSDPDIGDYTDDYSGCDTLLNAGYVYGKVPDGEFGSAPPSLFTSLLQGPTAFVPNKTFIDANGNGKFDEGETPLDTAEVFVNQFVPKRKIPGAKNLNMTSFISYIKAHPTHGDPGYRSETWCYLNGRSKVCMPINPCTWSLGIIVGGVDCSKVNPIYQYSGDPVVNIGWINDSKNDQRLMVNSGRFQLVKDVPVEIIVSYTVGDGNSPLNSVTVGKNYTNIIRNFYTANIGEAIAMKESKLKSRTTENKIDIVWETVDDFNYKDFFKVSTLDTLKNYVFENYELWMHSTPSTDLYVAGGLNSIKLASYDVQNEIDNLYKGVKDFEIENVFSKGIQLDPKIYSNPATGRIIFTVTSDTFNNSLPLIKGKPYYFSLRKTALNKVFSTLTLLDPSTKSYLLPKRYSFGLRTYTSKIFSFTPGEDYNSPYRFETLPTVGSTNAAESKVIFEEIEKSKITGDEYSLSFFKDHSSELYSMYWRLKNVTRDKVVLDSQKTYSNLDNAIAAADGLSPKIQWIEPRIKSPTYSTSSTSGTWFKSIRYGISGTFYRGSDNLNSFLYSLPISPLGNLGGKFSTITKFDHLRQIEIRFGLKQKAYRYVSNAIATQYISAGWTVSNPSVGKPGQYFVEVPFQVWMKDLRFGEEKQLACGFIERYLGFGTKPDGIWDPDTSIDISKEYIVIFNTPYDSSGKQHEYIGYIPVAGSPIWANLTGWDPPPGTYFTAEQIAKAKSPWFNALYVLGFEKKSATHFYSDGDIFTIPISYVLTERDTFYYKSKSKSEALTTDERKKMIERINVYPNPYYEWENPRDYLPSYQSFITFSNLPEEVTIKIYSLSGIHVRTLTESNKQSISSPFLNWDLKNESGNKAQAECTSLGSHRSTEKRC